MTEKTFQQLKFLRGWCQWVLPLAYDDSLSYLEQVCKIKHAVNQLIENNNNLPEYLEQLLRELLESDDLKKILAELMTDLLVNVKFPPAGIKPAVGDGTANDTESVQGCLDYLKEKGYGSLYFPQGQYLLSPITIPNGVSIFGFDRYATMLVAQGGVQSPFISTNGSNLSICNLTIDGHDGFQVNDILLLSMLGTDYLLTNLIFKDGYKHLYINGGIGHCQMDNLVFQQCVNNSVTIEGNIQVQANALKFDDARYNLLDNLITINSSHGYYDLYSSSQITNGIIVNGGFNTITAEMDNCSVPITDHGNNNQVTIRHTTQYQSLSGDYSLRASNLTENITGNRIVQAHTNAETYDTSDITAENIQVDTSMLAHTVGTFNGTYDEMHVTSKNYVGDIDNYSLSSTTSQFNATDNYTIKAPIISISSTTYTEIKDLIKYQTPKQLNEFFKYVQFTDGNDLYNILVENNFDRLKPSLYSKNNTTEQAINNILLCAESYLKNNNLLQYGNFHTAFNEDVTPNPKYEIDCSTFTQLCSMGVSFENSRYQNRTNVMIGGYPYENLEKNASGTSRPYGMLANELLQYCDVNGFSFTPQSVNELRPGDLVFIANSSDPLHYKKIGHCGIFLYYSEYNEGIYIISATDKVNPIGMEYLYINSTFTRYYARLPYLPTYCPVNPISNTGLSNTFAGPLTVTSTPIFTFDLDKKMEANSTYTIMIKTDKPIPVNVHMTLYYFKPNITPFLSFGNYSKFNYCCFTTPADFSPSNTQMQLRLISSSSTQFDFTKGEVILLKGCALPSNYFIKEPSFDGVELKLYEQFTVSTDTALVNTLTDIKNNRPSATAIKALFNANNYTGSLISSGVYKADIVFNGSNGSASLSNIANQNHYKLILNGTNWVSNSYTFATKLPENSFSTDEEFDDFCKSLFVNKTKESTANVSTEKWFNARYYILTYNYFSTFGEQIYITISGSVTVILCRHYFNGTFSEIKKISLEALS